MSPSGSDHGIERVRKGMRNNRLLAPVNEFFIQNKQIIQYENYTLTRPRAVSLGIRHRPSPKFANSKR